MEIKPAFNQPNRDPLPPGLIRLAAVLAEIAHNEDNCAFDLESPGEAKVEGLDENCQRGKTNQPSKN